MEEKRLETLLFNAIDILLNEGYSREEIMKELGMSQKEFEMVGEK